MPELNFTCAEDVAKLEGWRIMSASFDKSITGLRLVISHAAAEKPVALVIFASVNFQITGNSVIANPALSVRTEDV